MFEYYKIEWNIGTISFPSTVGTGARFGGVKFGSLQEIHRVVRIIDIPIPAGRCGHRVIGWYVIGVKKQNTYTGNYDC